MRLLFTLLFSFSSIVCLAQVGFSQKSIISMPSPVRGTPSFDNPPKITLMPGDTITVYGMESGYWKIVYKDSFTGYLAPNYIKHDSVQRRYNAFLDSLNELQYKKIKENNIIAAKQATADSLNDIRKAKIRMTELTKKYGYKLAEMLVKHVVKLGMTKEMVSESIGVPTHINRTVNSYSTSEQWVYEHSGAKTEFYYFTNGKLTSWQD